MSVVEELSSSIVPQRSYSVGFIEDNPPSVLHVVKHVEHISVLHRAEHFFSKPDNYDSEIIKTSHKKYKKLSNRKHFLLDHLVVQNNNHHIDDDHHNIQNNEDNNMEENNKNNKDDKDDEFSIQKEHDNLMKDSDINPSREFLLRYTLSYWVSIFFMLGSVYFILGGFGEIYKLGSDHRRDHGSFITLPYYIGGTSYTLGCYFGFWSVINLDRHDDPLPENGLKYHQFRFWAYLPELGGGYWSQLSYSIGGTWFFIGLFLSSPLLVAICFTIGSFFFTLGVRSTSSII